MVEDMNKAMAWTIAGVGRRTRDAAEEAARRAGMRLVDWLDEAIADQAAGEPGGQPEGYEAEDDRLDVAAGRLERIARQNARIRGRRPSEFPDSLNSAIERFETRLSRAEARVAHAFESVAQILERSNAGREGDRRAMIETVRRLEAIRAGWLSPAHEGEALADGLPPRGDGQRNLAERNGELAQNPGSPDAMTPNTPLDLKAVVSQIAMRRQELDARSGRDTPELMGLDLQTAKGGANAPTKFELGPAPARGEPALGR